MNIINFTPLPAFIGGTVIGLAVVIFYLGNGRLAGISGIIKNLVNSNNNRFDKETKNLIIFKKALFESNFVNELDLLMSLKPLINENTIWGARYWKWTFNTLPCDGGAFKSI